MHALNYTDLSKAAFLASGGGDGGGSSSSSSSSSSNSSSSVPPALVLATVAGYDYAVDGLPAAASSTAAKPLLQQAPPTATRPAMLVAATQLSGFVRRRYAPAAAWNHVLAHITTFLNGGTSGGTGGGGGGGGGPLPIDPAVLSITPAVRPTYGPPTSEPLPAGAERAALERSVQWYVGGGGGTIPDARLVLTHSSSTCLFVYLFVCFAFHCAHFSSLLVVAGTWAAA